jgi:hypothetical protein
VTDTPPPKRHRKRTAVTHRAGPNLGPLRIGPDGNIAPPRNSATGPSRDWWEPFLDALRERPVIAYACHKAGVSYDTVLRTRRQNQLFEHKFQIAKEEGLDGVELSMFDLAIDKGNVLAGIFLLKHGRPEQYHEAYVHRHVIEGGQDPVVVEHRIVPDYRDAISPLAPSGEILEGESRELPALPDPRANADSPGDLATQTLEGVTVPGVSMKTLKRTSRRLAQQQARSEEQADRE